METEIQCAVAGCGTRPHAKGYCRKHYGQIWRRGQIQPDEEERQIAKKQVAKNDSDRMRAMERELRRAEAMYKNVVGFEGRLKWRREIDEVKREMVRLGIVPPAPASLLADIA